MRSSSRPGPFRAWLAGAAAAIVIATSSIAPAAAEFPGHNAYIRAYHLESTGRLAEAEEAYLGIVMSNPSPKATDRALRRLLALAERQGDRGREMSFLLASFRAGNVGAAKRIAVLHNDYNLVPKTLGDLLPYYERNAANGHASSALVLAKLADQGRLAGSGVSVKTSVHWYRVAAKNGATGAVKTLFNRALAGGRDEEARSLLTALPASDAAELTLKAAKMVAFEVKTPKPARIIAWAGALPRAQAQEIYARLAKSAAASGNVDTLSFWLEKVDDVAAVESASVLRRAYSAESDPKAKSRIFEALDLLAEKGDAAAIMATFKIVAAEHGPTDPQTRPYLLRTAKSGNAKAVEAIAESLAFLPPGDPATKDLVDALEATATAGGTSAMMALGQLYATGGPVPIDLDRSAHWYRTAADAGVAEAQYRMGLAYSSGTGSDREKAVEWLAKAAKGGHTAAKDALDSLTVTN